MAQISEIKINDLGMALRIDAQFYQPRYIIDTSHGKWSRIKEILHTCEYGLSLAMNDKEIGVPMFKMDDIDHMFLIDDAVRFAKVSQKDRVKYACKVNDVFFNRVNSEEFVGRTGIFKLKIDSVFASYLIRLRTRVDVVLPQYLCVFLNSQYGQKQIDRYKRRAVNQANVNAQELQEFLLFIPSLEDQRKISQMVDESWSSLQKSKILYSQAEQLLLSELGLEDFAPEWVAGYETDRGNVLDVARMDAEYFQPRFARIINQIKKTDYSTLGKLVTSIKKGVEVGSEAYTDSGVPFIRVSNLSKTGINDDSQKFISKDLYDELKEKHAPRQGEILLSKDGSPGIAFHLREHVKGIISGGIVRLKPTEIEAEYLSLVLNSIVVKMQVDQEAGGALITHWRPDQIRKTLIPILPEHTREDISHKVQESFSALQESRRLLEQAKKDVEDMIEGKS